MPVYIRNDEKYILRNNNICISGMGEPGYIKKNNRGYIGNDELGYTRHGEPLICGIWTRINGL